MHSLVTLDPVTVTKPWGREVWYSGIEERGESGVRVGGTRVPLSRYLAAHGRREPLILLKALRPEIGNLYVEVHETKWEVYVVDQLDADQWPASGQMLLGANVDQRRRLGDSRFRAELLAVARRALRNADAEPVGALLNAVALQPGDAVTIPARMPHSLLRGVQVIEFQTPDFERKILAASQPVATQPGWDSDEAVAIMDLSSPRTVVTRCAGARQLLAETPTFSLCRHTLAARSAVVAPPWSVGWVAQGEVATDSLRLPPRSAFVAAAATRLRAVGEAELLLAAEDGADAA